MDPMDVLVICGLIVAFVYGLGLFLVVLAKVLGRWRYRGGFRADSSASDVNAGAGAIFADGLEAGSAEGGGSELGAGNLGSGDMGGPDFSGLTGGDFGGDFGGFGGGGL